MRDFSALRLLLVTDGKGEPDRILSTVSACVRAGLRAVQVRELNMPDAALYELLLSLKRILVPKKGLLFVNERPDLCLAADADGVQLGFRSYDAGMARKLIGRKKWVGLSIHSIEELRFAEKKKADFVIFGPVFSTPSKRGLVAPAGIAKLRQLVQASSLPLIAIGGIRPNNASRVLSSGCHGLALIRGVWDSANPCAETEKLLAAWNPASQPVYSSRGKK